MSEPLATKAIDVTGVLRQTDLLRSVPASDLEPIAAASRLRRLEASGATPCWAAPWLPAIP